MSLRVRRLSIHPIKSCARLDVDQFQIGESGPQMTSDGKTIGDREWMFVDAEGKFLTQRALTQMALIRPQIVQGRFTVTLGSDSFEIPLQSVKERMTVSVWGKEVNAARIETPLNQAVSDFLKKPVQLVRFDDQSDREALKKGRGLGVQTRFTDTQPYLVVTEESLADLNSKMSTPIGPERFRPNIVLSGAEKAFAEDEWTTLGNGTVIFESTKACGRCKIITVDPLTGKVASPEPLQALARYRRSDSSVIFGMYFLSRTFGETLKVQDQLDSYIEGT